MSTIRKWRLLLIAAALFLSPLVGRAQTTDGLITNKFLAASAGGGINLLNTGIAYHELTWHVVGSASGCTVALDSSADGITWSAGGAITGQTCTSNGNSSVVNVVANYVRINMTALTISAGGSVSVTWTGYVNSPSGGGGSPGSPAGGYQFNQGGSFVGTANVLDCTVFAGADLGAKWNACISAAPTGSRITLANFTGTQTLSTAVNINKTVSTDCGGITVTQQAAVTLSGYGATIEGNASRQCTFNKAGNIDQFTSTYEYNTIRNLTLNGGTGSGYTGNGIVVATGGSNALIENNVISGEAAADILISSPGVFKEIPATVRGNNLTNNGVNAFWYSGTNAFQVNFISNIIIDAGAATGAAIRLTGYAYIEGDKNAVNVSSATPGASLAVNTTFHYSHGTLIALGGYPAVDAPSGGNIQLLYNNNILGGGANGAIINSPSEAGVRIIGNVSIGNHATGSDGIIMEGDQGNEIADNFIGLGIDGQAGKCAVHLVNNSLGGIVRHNAIQLSGGSSAVGHNFGVCLTTHATSHTDDNLIVDNQLTGQVNANDFGMYFDNSANQGSSYVMANIFRNNQCIDMGTCISRNDPANSRNYYDNNTALATPYLFDSGGSTNDIVFEIHVNNFTQATLPVAGEGSLISCNDCSRGINPPGSSSGAMVIFQQGSWVGLGTGPFCANYTTVNVTGTGTGAQVLQQCAMPAGLLKQIGSTLRVHTKGVYTVPITTAPTLTVKVMLCLNSGCATDPFPFTLTSITSPATSASGVTNAPFYLDGYFTNTNGFSGGFNYYDPSAVEGIDLGAATTTALTMLADQNTSGATAADLSGDVFILVTITLSASPVSFSATGLQLLAWIE